MKHDRSRTLFFKRLIAAAVLLFTCFLCYFIGKPLVRFVLEPDAFRAWIDELGALGVLAFICMNMLQVFLAFIPGGPFEICAGYAFGAVRGILICDLAMTAASVLIFLLVRRFGLRYIELFISREKIESVRFLKSSGRTEGILFLLFLIPGTPKDLLSYLVGMTDLSLSHWIFICAVGRLPAICLSVLSGNALSRTEYGAFALLIAGTCLLSVCGALYYRARNK